MTVSERENSRREHASTTAPAAWSLESTWGRCVSVSMAFGTSGNSSSSESRTVGHGSAVAVAKRCWSAQELNGVESDETLTAVHSSQDTL